MALAYLMFLKRSVVARLRGVDVLMEESNTHMWLKRMPPLPQWPVNQYS